MQLHHAVNNYGQTAANKSGKKVASCHSSKPLRPQVSNPAALLLHGNNVAVAPDVIARLLERQWKTQKVLKPLEVQQANDREVYVLLR